MYPAVLHVASLLASHSSAAETLRESTAFFRLVVVRDTKSFLPGQAMPHR